MKVILHRTRTGVISGKYYMLSFLHLPCAVVHMQRFLYFMFFVFFGPTGFTSKSFLIVGIPEGLTIRKLGLQLQDL